MKPVFKPLPRPHRLLRQLSRKWRPCLKCGRRLYTDPYHRLCEICTVENEKLSSREGRVSWALAESLAAAGEPPNND